MRTTMLVVLSSIAACAPVGNSGGGYDDDVGPDAGVDGGSVVNGPCDELVEKSMDLNITGTGGFNNLPTTCWKLNGKLTLSGPAVTSVSKLGDLRGVVDLEIIDTDLTTFDSKTKVDVTGALVIRNNDKLTDASNVAPKAMLDSITVEGNAALTSFGVPATRVFAATSITNNVKLATLNLGSAQRLEGGLSIRDNAALTSVDLKALQSSGSVTIANNAQLRTLSTTSGWENVHGSLTIDNNDQLTTLGTLGNSIVIDVNAVITNNALLADVGQLDRAQGVYGIQLTGNTSLGRTQVNSVACCVNATAFSASNNQTNSQCNGGHWCGQNCYRHD